MTQLFLSHSSHNNFQAIALRNWLVSEGWDDLFLDLDPERGIVAGERWERALHQAASRCDAVLFLVSNKWLASEWCLREFELAQRLNKRIFGVLVEDLQVDSLPDKLTSTWQLVNLASGSDHEVLRAVHPDTGEERHVNFSASGLKRLRAGLVRAGLDPKFFDWPPAQDPDRAPYRGMRALEAEDAGIFFGREAPTIELMAELRGLRESPPPRLLVILGASGAGKSSFLRAGLLPRLAREDRHFVVLPVVRPGQDVLDGDDGLIRAMSQASQSSGLTLTRAALRAQVLEGDPSQPSALAETLKQISHQRRLPTLRGESDTRDPTLVLAIDQVEELFVAEGAEASGRFLELIKALTSDQSVPLMVLMTIRSDSYEHLQTAPALTSIRPRLFSLPPMPQGNYRMVIEGPIARLNASGRKLTLEPKLADRLLEDIQRGGGKDALPLLAFTLERLYLDYGGDGDLRLEEYEDMRGINGAIDAAVEQALTAGTRDPRLPSDRTALITLLRRGLIPWLAGIDPDNQAPRRRIARANEIPEEARPIIEHLVSQRLLATDVNDDGESTIEPAHEALLRQWGRLKDWLEDDFAALTTLEALQRATRDWEANERDDRYLVHHAGRLEDAENLTERPDLDEALTRSDRAYLKACRKREDEERDRELMRARELAEAQVNAAEQQRRVAKRTRVGLVVALALASVAGVSYWQADWQAEIAEAERDRAERQTEVAETNLQEANHNFGLALVERADARAAESRHQEALYYRLHAHSKLKIRAQYDNVHSISMGMFEAGFLPVWSSQSTSLHDGQVYSVAFGLDETRLLSAAGAGHLRSGHEVGVWDFSSGELLTTLQGNDFEVTSAAFSPDGKQVAFGTRSSDIKLMDVETGELKATLLGPTSYRHTSDIGSLAFRPDGARLASGSADNTIKLWDVATAALLSTLEGHSDRISSVAFSRDGARLASGSRDNTIKLWDVETGALLSTLEGHSFGVNSVAFSPDGTRLASGSLDNTIKLWDVETGALLSTLEGYTVAFNPDGTRLASGSWDNTIKLWDVETGALLSTLEGRSGLVSSIAFSSDGRRLTSGSLEGMVSLWDVTDGLLLTSGNGHSRTVNSVALTPDDSWLASGASDNTIKLWDVAAGELVRTLEGHASQVRSVSFSPDGTWLASGSDDNTIKFWDVETGALLSILDENSGDVKCVAFSPDGTQLASGSDDNTIKLWNVETGALLSTLEGHLGPVTSLAFSPDGARLASASEDKTIRLWDKATAAPLSTLDGHSRQVNTVAFSPDGKQLASGARDNTIKLWDVEAGTELSTLKGHSHWVQSVGFNSDGTLLVSGSMDRTLKIWDVATSGEEIYTLEGHRGGVTSVTFGANGMWLASASQDRTVKFWDARGMLLLSALDGHSNRINSVTFSPDGARLASASDDDTINLWDVESGVLLFMLGGHSSRVNSVAFSPDGMRLASGSNDNTIKLWNIETGALLSTLEVHSGSVNSVSFSPDGIWLAAASEDQTVSLWEAASGILLRTLNGFSYGVGSVSFSPDGSRLVSDTGQAIKLWNPASGQLLATIDDERNIFPSFDIVFSPDRMRLAAPQRWGNYSIDIWDVTSGALLNRLDGHSSTISSIAFSPDGAWLASGSDDNTINLWEVVSGKLLTTISQRHSKIGNTVTFSPEGMQLAAGADDGGIQLWDMTWLNAATNDIASLLEQQRLVTGMRLDGFNLVYEANAKLLKAAAATGTPFWRETDPFFWLPEARQGDTDAMIHAGNSFFRRNQHDLARHWFEQAIARGDERAEERLELLERTLAREE